MKLHFLAKIGTRENMEDLYHNGTVYMNTIKYFKKEEENEQKRDDREGILHIKQMAWFDIEVNGKIYKFRKEAGVGVDFIFDNGQYREEAELLGNVYCTYAITDELVKKTDRIDQKCKGLGDTMVLITKPLTFIKRVRQALDAQQIGYTFDYVSYYDEKGYEGDLSIFHKPNSFAHQNEYRMAINNDKFEPVKFTIGSIADIAVLVDSYHVIDTWRFKYKKESNGVDRFYFIQDDIDL
jgi:hypothetical protein